VGVFEAFNGVLRLLMVFLAFFEAVWGVSESVLGVMGVCFWSNSMFGYFFAGESAQTQAHGPKTPPKK
jgi:hypothetical protein